MKTKVVSGNNLHLNSKYSSRNIRSSANSCVPLNKSGRLVLSKSKPKALSEYAKELSFYSKIKSLFNKNSFELECINSKIISKTYELIKCLSSIATKNNLWWDQPLGNISIDNEIVLEWWHKEKKITIYVCTNSIDYIKVWGADMDNEMEDGSISLNENELTSLWKWLTEKELG